MNFQMTAIAAAAALIIGIGIGWKYEHAQFMVFKEQVEAEGKAAQAKADSINQQHDLVTKGIKDEYDAKLSTLRNYYKSTSVWNSGTDGSAVSGISATPKSADVIAAYNELAANCAQTTLMLVELQKWLNEQVGIK